MAERLPGGGRILGAVAIRAAFEAIFSNGAIRAWPERVRRIDAMASVVHNVLERIDVQTPEGPRRAYVIATNSTEIFCYIVAALIPWVFNWPEEKTKGNHEL